jgi:hypothetical protein
MASAETKAVAIADEGELVKRISDQLKVMEDTAIKIKQTILQQAIEVGGLLLQAKERVGHGKFGSWLEKHKLAISERSAQRYMALKEEWPKIEAWMKTNSATVADLSLNKAEKIIAATPDPPKASDLYDKAQDNLIKKLKELAVEEADAASAKTIAELRKTVGTMKAGAKNAA